MLNIYITNLGKYNEGHLVGEWVELPVSQGNLEKVFERIGINERYEEFFITDYETDIDNFRVGEYDNLSELNELAEALENLDKHDKEIVKTMISEGYELKEAIEKKDDCIIYSDCHDMEDVAIEYAEETGLLSSIPEHLRNYFDYKAFGRDMSFEGHFVFTSNGNCVQIL